MWYITSWIYSYSAATPVKKNLERSHPLILHFKNYFYCHQSWNVIMQISITPFIIRYYKKQDIRNWTKWGHSWLWHFCWVIGTTFIHNLYWRKMSWRLKYFTWWKRKLDIRRLENNHSPTVHPKVAEKLIPCAIWVHIAPPTSLNSSTTFCL